MNHTCTGSDSGHWSWGFRIGYVDTLPSGHRCIVRARTFSVQCYLTPSSLQLSDFIEKPIYLRCYAAVRLFHTLYSDVRTTCWELKQHSVNVSLKKETGKTEREEESESGGGGQREKTGMQHR